MVFKVFKNEKNDQVKDRKKIKQKIREYKTNIKPPRSQTEKNVEPITYSYHKKFNLTSEI